MEGPLQRCSAEVSFGFLDKVIHDDGDRVSGLVGSLARFQYAGVTPRCIEVWRMS